jgi:PAS domain S-box-containing protein
MNDSDKTKQQLIHELSEARQWIAELRLQREIIVNIAEGICLIRVSDGVIVYANPRFDEMFGYSPGEMIGQHASIVNAPTNKNPEETAKEIIDALDKHGFWQGEVKNIKQDGAEFWCNANVSTFNHPEFGEVWVAVHTDITERKQAEDVLRNGQQRAWATFNAISDTVFLHPLLEEGFALFVDVNDTACERYGYTREEFLTLRAPDITKKVDANVHATPAHRRTLQDARRMIFEATHITKSGEEFPVEINSTIIELSGRQMILAVVRDITERKQAEKERLQLVLERERMQLLANFITNAAHEFKTPLTIINTGAYLLRKSDDLDDRQRHVDTIEEQVKSIVMLVDALNLMSKLDAMQVLPSDELDLNAVVNVVYKTRQVDFEAIGHNAVLESSDSPLLLQGHHEYLIMVMENILDNAIHHTPAGGTIIIRALHTDDCAIVEILDTGTGISDEQLPHIFERFYRADVAATTRGFGLGLPIAKSIIEHHNGRIEVKSEVGKGSTFRVIIPLE